MTYPAFNFILDWKNNLLIFLLIDLVAITAADSRKAAAQWRFTVQVQIDHVIAICTLTLPAFMLISSLNNQGCTVVLYM